MSLKIYNTLIKDKQVFEPLEPGKVKMYVCGPTVYDLLHVGNFRGAVFFNLFRNWLEKSGYEVNFVYNFTDIDDKIIKRANEQGVTALEISSKYIGEFQKDYDRLGLKPHTNNPKCSDYIPQMVDFVQTLVDKGFAYDVDGEVFYEIEKFDGYGKLNNKNLEDLEAGHRVEADAKKRNPFDFVLWKPAKDGEPGWDSPWGQGRPGWHLECSVMNKSILGDQIDIHGGGCDLQFPHHENEIAQSEACTGKQFAQVWMHNNFINFGEEKMSKSLGNVIKAREFMDDYNPEILKFMILSVHYRSFLNMNESQVMQAIQGLERIYSALEKAEFLLSHGKGEPQETSEIDEVLAKATEEIEKSYNDDVNTPQVFAQIFNVIRTFNDTVQGKKNNATTKSIAKKFQDWIKEQGKLLALFQENPKDFLNDMNQILIRKNKVDVSEVDALIEKRQEARANKDFETADQVRGKLEELGIDVQDTPQGTVWRVNIKA